MEMRQVCLRGSGFKVQQRSLSTSWLCYSFNLTLSRIWNNLQAEVATFQNEPFL